MATKVKNQKAASQPKTKRIQSDFPKHSLKEALKVPLGLFKANGGNPLPPIEAAEALGVSPGSSDFRVILSSSIKYGLTSGSFNTEKVAIEPLGHSIAEPKSDGEKQKAIVSAALNPTKFSQVFEYYKGKKVPEATFFANTVVREFQIPREQAALFVKIFLENMRYIGLVKALKNGEWLSTEAPKDLLHVNDPSQEEETDEDEVEEEGTKDLDEEPAIVPRAAANNGRAKMEDDQPQKNAIFIGHGKNKKPLEQLKKVMDQFRIPYKVAIDEPNKFRPISQKVAETMRECGAAILIFSADEQFLDKDGKEIWRPSENVVYELGASSILYGGRIIIFKEDIVDFPTNFKDIGYISFAKDSLEAKTNELFGELISFGIIKVSVGS
jgi:predicted nucleotide-binding protein